MRTVFKIGFLLVVTLGYAAWSIWSYNEFGAEFTPECLAIWAYMVMCKFIVGVVVYWVWESAFDSDYGTPIMRNPPRPPKKHTKVNYKPGKTAY